MKAIYILCLNLSFKHYSHLGHRWRTLHQQFRVPKRQFKHPQRTSSLLAALSHRNNVKTLPSFYHLRGKAALKLVYSLLRWLLWKNNEFYYENAAKWWAELRSNKLIYLDVVLIGQTTTSSRTTNLHVLIVSKLWPVPQFWFRCHHFTYTKHNLSMN